MPLYILQLVTYFSDIIWRDVLLSLVRARFSSIFTFTLTVYFYLWVADFCIWSFQTFFFVCWRNFVWTFDFGCLTFLVYFFCSNKINVTIWQVSIHNESFFFHELIDHVNSFKRTASRFVYLGSMLVSVDRTNYVVAVVWSLHVHLIYYTYMHISRLKSVHSFVLIWLKCRRSLVLCIQILNQML